MWIIRQVGAVTLAVAFLAASASAQQSGGDAKRLTVTGASGAATGAAADKAMMDAMSKMQQDMATAPMTGDPDQDFVAMMMPHHQGAVDMAEIELKYGKDPEMLKLARGIVDSQSREHAEMMSWRKKHAAK